MIDLNATEHGALRRVAAAGQAGLTLAELGAALAIRLSLEGFIRITRDEPQRVVATAQGAAFARRGVHA